MSRPGWYNDNLARSYPFVPLEGSDLPHSAIVDFGAMLFRGVDVTTAYVYLHTISRSLDGNTFVFTFKSSDLVGDLVFTRTITDDRYTTEHSSVQFSEDYLCAEDKSVWSGYLVTGDLTELAELIDPDTVYNFGTDYKTEPNLTQHLVNHFAETINIANQDRSRTNNREDCRSQCWEHDTGGIFIKQTCITGNVRFRPGYNCTIRQTGDGLVFAAAVGAGLGEPCEEIPLFEGESAPANRTLLSGSPTCQEVLRSVNGSGGKNFVIRPGDGIEISTDPVNHKITVSVNMSGLSVCYDTTPSSDSYSEFDDGSDSCDCGEV